MKKHPFVIKTEKLFLNHADKETAAGMKAYMRDQFEFLGIKKTPRADLLKLILEEYKNFTAAEWPQIVRQLWQSGYREFQYISMELCRRRHKEFTAEHLTLFEHMITDKSWWDTVDFVAANLVGDLFRKDASLMRESIDRWIKSDNLWLHRSAIIFQLKYGKNTDARLLFDLCSRFAVEKDFFIRKAIGWALRQYSKSNPAAVRKYLEKQPLSSLSVKEASKYI